MVTGGEDNKVNLWAIGKTNCIMVSTVSSLKPILGYVLRNTKTGVTDLSSVFIKTLPPDSRLIANDTAVPFVNVSKWYTQRRRV